MSIRTALARGVYRVSPGPVQTRLKARVAADGEFAVTLPGGETLRLAEVRRSEMLKDLYWQGFRGFEADTVGLFYELARSASVVFDIGAYFFYYGLVAAKARPSARVFCFEPLPENFALGQRFAELNGLGNLTAVKAALSDRSGEATFYVPDRSLSALPNIGSLKNRFRPGESFSDRGAKTIAVECLTVDEFVEREGLPTVDLIKIDTEETEVSVLRGATRTLDRFRPDVITEVIPEKQPLESFAQVLSPFGYRPREIGPMRGKASRSFGEFHWSAR